MKLALTMAGGRQSIISQLNTTMPHQYNRIIEARAGTLALSLPHQDKTRMAYDSDPNVINVHNAVKCHPDELVRELAVHESAYNSLDCLEAKREYYYSIRELINSDKYGKLSGPARAAAYLTMIKLGFNGLVRTNSQGKFNVPFGKKPSVSICNEPVIRDVHAAMSSLEIVQGDIHGVSEVAKAGDFVFLDPAPISAKMFDSEILRLVLLCKKLDAKEASWMLLLPEHAAARKTFDEYTIQAVSIPTRISAAVSGRCARTLMVITNYPTSDSPKTI